MKVLKFRPHLVKLILEGSKTTTWRLFDDKNLQAGDKLTLQNWETGKDFASAEITEITEKKLGELESSDFDGHEKFADQKDMMKHYQEYYGDKVTLDTIVKIIKFKIAEVWGE